MHIAVFYCCSRLPIEGYGGTERVVVSLVRALTTMGHRVTLIAPEGSAVPPATVVPLRTKHLDLKTFDISPLLPPDADILHSFSMLRIEPRLPNLWTIEGNFREGQVPPANTIYVSANHAERNGGTAFVYNGVDPAEMIYRVEKSDYDLFLGRLHKIKGYHWAIEGARRTRRRLIVAGGWRPSLSRSLSFAGSVDGVKKAELIAGARFLWMPALWEEPFGLTLAEALLCGTPILGTRRGSLPEIISSDVGSTADTLDELVDLIPTIAKKKPEDCRARGMKYFTHDAMAAEYVRFYEHYLREGKLPDGRRAGA
ncbi:MAG: glycosyltransferase [Gemmatimonadota bacterium]